MNILDRFPVFRNKAAKSKRITEGSNVTRPGATVILTQPQRFGIGLGDYMQAIRSAENVDFTRRVRLYDIYSESLMDPHLFSVVQKRKSGVLSRKIEFRRNGIPDDKVNEQISSPWFLRFISDALDAEYWGFTLVQFYINTKGWIDYYLAPRKHIDPVLRIIKTRQEDINGESFDNYGDLLMIRGKEPLGILARTAPYVIYSVELLVTGRNSPRYSACRYVNIHTMRRTRKLCTMQWKLHGNKAEEWISFVRKDLTWNLWKQETQQAAVNCTAVSWNAVMLK